MTLQKQLRELNHLNLRRKIAGLLRHYKISLVKLKKLSKLNKRDIYPHITDTFFTYTWSNAGFSKNIICRASFLSCCYIKLIYK